MYKPSQWSSVSNSIEIKKKDLEHQLYGEDDDTNGNTKNGPLLENANSYFWTLNILHMNLIISEKNY